MVKVLLISRLGFLIRLRGYHQVFGDMIEIRVLMGWIILLISLCNLFISRDDIIVN